MVNLSSLVSLYGSVNCLLAALFPFLHRVLLPFLGEHYYNVNMGRGIRKKYIHDYR